MNRQPRSVRGEPRWLSRLKPRQFRSPIPDADAATPPRFATASSSPGKRNSENLTRSLAVCLQPFGSVTKSRDDQYSKLGVPKPKMIGASHVSRQSYTDAVLMPLARAALSHPSPVACLVLT